MKTLKKLALVLATVLGLSMLAGCALFGSANLAGTKWTNDAGLIYEFGTDGKVTITVPGTESKVLGITVKTDPVSTSCDYSVNGDELTITTKDDNTSTSETYQVVEGKKTDDGLRVVYLQQNGTKKMTLTQVKESK